VFAENWLQDPGPVGAAEQPEAAKRCVRDTAIAAFGSSYRCCVFAEDWPDDTGPVGAAEQREAAKRCVRDSAIAAFGSSYRCCAFAEGWQQGFESVGASTLRPTVGFDGAPLKKRAQRSMNPG